MTSLTSSHSAVGYKRSPLQDRTWRSGLARAPFGCGAWIGIEGALDVLQMEDVLRQLANQHEILRTTFQQVSGTSELLQVISPDPEVAVRVRQVADVASGAQKFTPRAYYQAKLSQQREEAAPFSAEAIQIDNERFDLFLQADPLCCDSTGVLLLVRAIATALSGTQLDAGGGALQYADFAESCETLREEESVKEAVRFWEQHNCQPASSGCANYEQACLPAFRPALVYSTIKSDAWSKLRELCASWDVGLDHLLLYAWYIAVRAYGHRDLRLVTDIRRPLQLDDAIGLYSGHLPLRWNSPKGPSLRDEIGKLKSEIEALQPRQLGYLLNVGDSETDSASFEFQQFQRNLQFGQAKARIGWLHSHNGRFALKLSCLADNNSAETLLHYNAATVTGPTASRVLESFLILLASFAVDPEMPARSQRLFSAKEEDRLVRRGNSEVDWESSGDLNALISPRVKESPDSIAVEEDGHWVTARELDRRANQWTRVLRAAGASLEDHLIVDLPRSTDLVIAMLACCKAGIAYIPLDKAAPPARKLNILRESRALWLITDDSSGWQSALPVMPQILTPALFEQKRHQYSSAALLATHAEPENLAYVIYTSGSAGLPKGVAITRRGLANYLRWAASHYPSLQPGTPLFLSPAFDLSVTSILVPWLKDDRIVIYSGENAFDDLGQVLSSGRTFGLLKITPSHLRLLREKFATYVAGAPPCDSLIVGGESLNADLVKWWRDRWPQTHIYNEYGPTETVVGSMIYEVQLLDGAADIPIGRAVANTRVYITDEYMRSAPDDVEGELAIAGVGVARGYLGRPDLTAEKFVPNVLSGRPGERLYLTGDRAIFSGSVFHYRGRADRQVKIRGYRVELAEIESALKKLAGIADGVVLPVKTNGADERVLAAFVIRAADVGGVSVATENFAEGLRSGLANVLPELVGQFYF